MKNFINVLRVLVSAFTLSIPAVAIANWEIKRYDVTGNNVEAVAINNLGQVLINDGSGSSYLTGLNGVGLTKLGGSINPSDINDSGQITGTYYAVPGTNPPHVFITGPDGIGITDLGDFNANGSGSNLGVAGINNSGQIAVNARSCSSCPDQAFITDPNGSGVTKLETLYGDLYPDGTSFATGINDSGQVTGYSSSISGHLHGFITGPDGVGITDLGALISNSDSYPLSINNSGQVVGMSQMDLLGSYDAFITGANGEGMVDLGTLGGYFSRPFAINELGEVVGESTFKPDDPNDQHSFLFSHGGMTDLSLLDVVVAAGWSDMRAFDINNNGQIVGTGNLGAFLLSYTPDTEFDPKPIFIPGPMPLPVPEPASWAMLLVGIGLIGFISMRKTQILNL